ncbi:Condensin complex subunit 2 [Spironucleus salmonicida]|uniref:Condensin complex subunit 2 n=1 Tax=Spironucleus salmonicida TaxID=348837 RepID=V6LN99_9EUKA|nr:Condensin complex subunit 2 [Spironucleus salmonicida]|eukprot:EST46110.1 Condensin complex subunit 2 [Spironucleus salmonicida]
MNPEEVLNLCLQLAATDKINQKNCWQLSLIDQIDDVLDYENCDFVKCSGAIQASAKIYSGRVDALAQQCEGMQGVTLPQSQEDEEQQIVEKTQRSQQNRRKPLKSMTNEQLTMKIIPNAFFDPDFHKMFAIADEQILTETDLFKYFEIQENEQLSEIEGMQQLLTKSQRFMDASQLPEPSPIELNYDIQENDLNVSYASLLETSIVNKLEDQQDFSAIKNIQKLGPRAPPKPRAPKRKIDFNPPELKFTTISKTQSKFAVFQSDSTSNLNFQFIVSPIFNPQNCGKFLISNYLQTNISRLPSITELSFHKNVAFQSENFDEIDNLIEEFHDEKSMNIDLVSQKLRIGLNTIQTKFAKKSKQIDIQELKKKELSLLKENVQDLVKIHQTYPDVHSQKVCQNAEDVSIQMMFVGFLHLANEGQVHIRQLSKGVVGVEGK